MDGKNFRFICYLNTTLWSSKFIKLDVCGRPFLANPVTYVHVYIKESRQVDIALLQNCFISPWNFEKKSMFAAIYHTKVVHDKYI